MMYACFRPKLNLFVLALFCSLASSAQTAWNLAAPQDGAGTTSAETGRGICTDAAGNVYMVGVFTSTGGFFTDFDLMAGTQLVASTGGTTDGFIVSYDKNGLFRWKTIIGGASADFNSASGAICTNGTYVWFAGNVNISGAPQAISSTNTITITGTGAGSEACIGKLNCSNGFVQWAQAFGGTGIDLGSGIAVDPGGCAYISGSYSGAFTLNSIAVPYSGTAGTSDYYLLKFTPTGVLRSYRVGGAASAADMIVTGSSICYVPGAAPSIIAVGSYGAGTASYGAFSLPTTGGNDAMLLELDTTLNVTNAISFGGSNALNDELLGAVYDPFSGGVYVAGYFNGSATLPGTALLTGAGVQDAVIARYSVASNNFTWSRSGAGPGDDRAYGIAADGQGGLLITGFTTSAPCTFGSFSISSSGLNEIFAAHYNTSGTPLWLLGAGGTGGDDGRGIACYVQASPYVQNVYITGNYQSTATFGAQPVLTGDGGNDFFLARINDLALPLSATQSQVNLTCNGVCTGSATVVASGGSAPYTYSWAPSGGSGATASSLCAGNYTCTITDNTSTSITKTFALTQPPAIVITPISQTNIACFGGSNGAAQLTSSGGTGTLTYNWTPGNPTGDGTGSVTGLTAGTWTCTVTDANSCVATRTFNITQPPALSVTPSSQTNVACFGGSNGAASINTPTGGAGGYTYNWTPGNPTGDGTTSVTGLTAGTWTCTVTDANACVASQTFNVTQPATPVSGSTVVTNVACFGGSNGALNLTPSGGTGPYSFLWLPSGPVTEDRTGLTAGTYSVQITDANGCPATVTATVTQPASPVSGSTVVTNVACFGGSNGAINLTPSGGTGPYSFNWLPSGPITEDRTGLTAGTYTVQITDANGCAGTVTATVTQPATPVSGSTVVTNVACFGGSNGAINLTPSGGTSPYSFNWLPSGPITEDRTGLTAGTYTVQITDANGCAGTVTATVTQPASPVSGSTVVTNVACFGGSNGAINLTPSGGTGPYSFNWLPSGPVTEDRTGLTAGTYSVQITDANGCPGTVTTTVTQAPALVVTPASQTNVACNGGSNGAASINTPTGGAGGYTYNWTPGNPTGDGTISVTGLTAGVWTCTITDANACVATQTFNVTQPGAIVVTPSSQTNIACFGGNSGAASINTPTGGAGGYTYNWTPGNPTGDGTTSVTGLAAGTWTCTVTDANACVATQTFNVTQPGAIVVTPSSQTNVACFGGSNGAASINTPTGGAGGYTYNWTPGNPTGDGTISVTGLTAGTWTCTVTDANACVATQTFNVTQPGAISVTPSSQTNIACFGGNSGAASINTPTGGAGGYTYNWTPGNPTGDGTTSVTGLTAGTWTCTVTDANACNATATFSITQPSAISVTQASQTNISCNGGSNGAASINTPTGGAGGYTYNWTPGNPTGDGTTSVTGLTAGTWTCTVTDANACNATATFSVTQPSAISVTQASQTNISCNGGSNGAASINTPTGGAGGYTYNWTPGNPTGDGTTSVSGLTVGTWTCTVTDANGCTATSTFNITQPILMIVMPFAQTNVSCNGGTNGAATVAVTGGTVSYSYDWTPGNPTGDGTASVSGLTTGTWTCLVTDANGCTGTQSFALTEPTALTVSSASNNVTCFGLTDGSSSVTVGGGTSPYTYAWSPTGGTNDTATGLGAGNYICTITDANGCIITETTSVTEPSALTASTMQTNVSCNGGANGDAMVMVSGGTPTYTYAWLPTGGTNPTASGLTAGTYTCTITDANSCSLTQTFTITEPGVLAASSTAGSILCNGGTTTVTVTGSGGTSPYTGEGTFTITAGTYSYTVTDANGCTATTSVTVTEPTALVSTSSATSVLCNGDSATVTVNASGGTAPYTGEGTFTVAAGPYSYTVTDANGCTSTTSGTITEPTAISTSVVSVNVGCNGDSTGSIDLTVTGGTGPYSFDWNNGAYTTEDLTGLGAGTYSGILTDANGCTDSGSVVISEPAILVATVAASTDPSSCGATDGSIDISVSGGTTGYTYLWNTSAITEDLTGVGAGAYSCVVTDTNGCTATVAGNLNDPNAPAVTLALSLDTLCFDDALFTLTGESPAGGTFSGTGVSGGSFDPAVAGVGMHTISYTYTDSLGCTGSTADSIYVDICMGTAGIVANASVSVYPNPNNGSFTVLLNAASSADVMLYDAQGKLVDAQKMQPGTQVQMNIAEPGMYLITVIGADGQRTSQRVVITK